MGCCTREVDLAARPQTRESKKYRIPLSQTFLEPREVIDKYCISVSVANTLSDLLFLKQSTLTKRQTLSQIMRRASLYDRKTLRPNERAVSNCDPIVLSWCRHCPPRKPGVVFTLTLPFVLTLTLTLTATVAASLSTLATRASLLPYRYSV
jgi:hypothetical protein